MKHSLISALKPSQYRKYWQIYNRKYDYKPHYDLGKMLQLIMEQSENTIQEKAEALWEEAWDQSDYFYDERAALIRHIAEESIDPDDYEDGKEDDEYIRDFDEALEAAEDEADNRMRDEYFGHYYDKAREEYEEYVWGELKAADQGDYNSDFFDLYNAYSDTPDPFDVDTDIKNTYDKLFNGKNRLYIPVNIEDGDPHAYQYSSLYMKQWDKIGLAIPQIVIAYLFASKNKKFISAMNGTSDIELSSLLREFIDHVEKRDSQENLALRKKLVQRLVETQTIEVEKDRFVRIGKIYSIIEKFKQSGEADNYDMPAFLPHCLKSCDSELYSTIMNFITECRKFNVENFRICISRHPYDIAGMSTDRGWESCMHLEDGSFRKYVLTSLMNGALVAYLINKDDKNIEHPRARCLLKPYLLDGYRLNFNADNPNWILIPSYVYGEGIAGFTETLEQWCEDNWNSKYGIEDKTYEFSEYCYQEDGDEDEIVYSR